MQLELNKAVVLGATGPAGIHLARELCRRSINTRVVSRSPEHLADAFADCPVDPVAADLRDPHDTARVLKGCDVVFNCLGVPLQQLEDHVTVAHNIAAAVAERAARVVHISSYWGYLPVQRLPLTESHPRRGGPRAAQLRREAEDILRSAGAAVVHLPDFYGPEVHSSTLQRALVELAQGKPVNWIGSTANERDYVFVPDAMASVAELAHRPEFYGQRWVLAGAGPISLQSVAEIAQRHLGKKPSLRGAGSWLLKLIGVFSPQLRAMLPLVPSYMQPISFDDKKLRRLLPSPNTTSYAQGIPKTLSWITRRTRSTTGEVAVPS